jgi:hypothetical protein
VALFTWCEGAGAQTSTLIGIVVSQSTGERLGYSIVALPTLGRERCATDSGVFSFDQLRPGAVPLRIRRLGYAPHDTVLTVSPDKPDTIRIALRRVVAHLSGVTVTAFPPCLAPGPRSQRIRHWVRCSIRFE